VPFQFPFIVLLRHGRGAIFNLQPSSSMPHSFNFNPSRQLHPSSTSILLANFIPHRRQLQPSSPFKFQTPSLCYFLPFSLMAAAVCLMLLLLPDELLTKMIIHSIKDVAVFHFLNLRNKIYGTFRRICSSERYYCTCRCVTFVRHARIATTGRALSGASARPIIRRHCASRGW
jgi:hypothetical protein